VSRPEQFQIGYIASTWPSLSQTFVLSEVLALERFGVSLRIFSGKDPVPGPVHEEVANVRAPVAYLSLRRHWRPALSANLRMVRDTPSSYLQTLLEAARYARWGVVRRFFEAAFLADTLRRDPVSHLHAHFATAPALIAMFVHRLIDLPFSFTAHARDIYVDTDPRQLQAEMRAARAVVTVSEYNRRHLARILGPDGDKVRCIHNGLDLRSFPFHPVESNDRRPSVIVSVGRLIEKKGFPDLIVAIDLMRGRLHNVTVQIIGSGPLRTQLEQEVRLRGLQGRIVFLGAQPLTAVRNALRDATVFVLPCTVAQDGDRDGIPTVLLEAMATGAPVVSTSVSGIPELVEPERTGLLVPPSDPASLAHALERLLGDPDLRRRLSWNARAAIEERFTADAAARQLIEVFEEASEHEPSVPMR
jgi:glycosyltransferase involved in cell wall biosynthesis